MMRSLGLYLRELISTREDQSSHRAVFLFGMGLSITVALGVVLVAAIRAHGVPEVPLSFTAFFSGLWSVLCALKVASAKVEDLP